jgi:hypothetical protein
MYLSILVQSSHMEAAIQALSVTDPAAGSWIKGEDEDVRSLITEFNISL